MSGAERRARPWLTMPVAADERDRWRTVPVAEIEAMQTEMAALKARIAELEARKPTGANAPVEKRTGRDGKRRKV
jgi:hypothetical protein